MIIAAVVTVLLGVAGIAFYAGSAHVRRRRAARLFVSATRVYGTIPGPAGTRIGHRL